jgi:glycosyltransferase involved in cell wall biosynthesis
VASAIGGLPELVAHEDTGLLVHPGDTGALREALEDVTEGRRLAGGRDPVTQITIAEGARGLDGLYASLAPVGPHPARV